MDRTHSQTTTQQAAPAETPAAPRKRFRFVKIEESAGSKAHTPHASSKGHSHSGQSSASSGFSVMSTIY
jgi:hypothetical protein